MNMTTVGGIEHRSFTFQDYLKDISNELGKIELPDLRRVNLNNILIHLFNKSYKTFKTNQMIEEGVAKECARMVLPLCTPTRIMTLLLTNLRSAHGEKRIMEMRMVQYLPNSSLL